MSLFPDLEQQPEGKVRLFRGDHDLVQVKILSHGKFFALAVGLVHFLIHLTGKGLEGIQKGPPCAESTFTLPEIGVGTADIALIASIISFPIYHWSFIILWPVIRHLSFIIVIYHLRLFMGPLQ